MDDTPTPGAALSLLVNAARVSPVLRDAVATVEDERNTLRSLLREARDVLDGEKVLPQAALVGLVELIDEALEPTR